MALTRARVITGDEMLGQIVTADIRAVLTRPRDPDKLLADVAHMRNRMVAQHRQQPALWDCKHRRGGLIDIEFITQYLLLRHASTEPAILATGTAEVLRRLIDAEILAEDTGAALLDALALWHQVQGVLRVTLEAPESAGLPLDVVDRLLTRATGIADPALRTHRIDQAALTALAIYDRLIGVPAAVLPKPETGLS
ncbi:MAG TPA: glutamine-synthetase adenylyltransferase, partial [Stellaceae bacterium]|nr:glutamine-synthetase adenylyltransferase [Stellaceae bacterium]